MRFRMREGKKSMCNALKGDRENDIQSLVGQVEREREKLIQIGSQKGFQHPAVLAKSECLDTMINQYYTLIDDGGVRTDKKP